MTWARIALLGMGTVLVQSAWVGEALADEWKYTTLTQDSAYYKIPNANGEVLGRLQKGTRIRVFTPAKNGWYATYLAQPIKGTRYAYIPGNVLDLSEARGSSPQSSSGKSTAGSTAAAGAAVDPNTWISAGAIMTQSAPSVMQVAIGDTALAVSHLSFGASAGHYLGERFFLTARAGLNNVVAPTGAAGAYTASGYWGTFGAGYMFIRKAAFSVGLEAAAGISLMSAGNAARNTTTGQTNALTTTGIIGTPLQAGVLAKVRLYKNMGLEAQAAYQIHTLSAVPFYRLNTANVQVTPDLDLGGLGFGARVYYAF